MNAPVNYSPDTTSPLRCRKPGGGTAEMTDWYLKSETGPLLDVLLGPVDSFYWLGLENAEYSSLVRDSLRRGRKYDAGQALRHDPRGGASRDVLDAQHHTRSARKVKKKVHV